MRKVLIANRGEIAVRLILACRELGLATVAVYASPDAESPHVWLADEAYALAGQTPKETYLDAEKLLAVAAESGADAVHPGYGFLSERAEFAEACMAAGLTWVGPPGEAIARLGDKLEARHRAQAAGVPVLPGGVITGDPASWPEASDYPVMVKAAGGGGGMGLRRVEDPQGFQQAVAEARAQCEAAFSAAGGAVEVTLYWEAYVTGGRHIEVQVVADAHGAVAHLGERECSIQRRYQKIIEESPSPALDHEGRQAIGQWAVAVASAVGYANVGTVEFLWSPQRGATFLEMNTRLQVEHPVTELVWGCDLVAMQLRLAAGEPLEAVMPAGPPRGWALEARVYAEDPVTGAPSAGRLDHVRWPSGPWVRVDAGVESGMEVSPYFDPLLAKVIAWGPERETAVRRLGLALARTELVGTLTTNLPLLRGILAEPDFLAGALDTRFLVGREVARPVLGVEATAVAASLASAAPEAGPREETGVPDWARRRWR